MKSKINDSALNLLRTTALLFLYCFALAFLFQAMRGVLERGGFMASGGPYLVTHPDPGWGWLMAVAITLVVVSLSAGFALQARGQRIGLMVFSWPALFLSLGWNFLDFGLGWRGGTAVNWSDLVAGLLFFLVGGIPLAVMLLDSLRRRKERGTLPAAKVAPRFVMLLEIAVAAAAIWLGSAVFRSMS